MDADLSEYISQLLEVDLVVTAGMTSLPMDAANLGIAAVSVMADSTGVMARRHTHLVFDSTGRSRDFPPLPIVHRIDQLVPLVEELFRTPERAKTLARELASEWDYDGTDFKAMLLKAVTD